jgi:hypothetical protein
MFAKFENHIASIFFILALFPFVSFGTNSMDSQPFYIFFAMLSFLFFASSGLIFKESLNLIILTIIVLLTIFLTSTTFDFIFIRGVASYLGFFITLIVSIVYFERFGIPVKFIVISNIIYLFVGILQFLYDPLIANFLVLPNGYPNMIRGATSLTPEHTFYGIVLFFFSWINLIIYDYKPPKLISILIIINLFSIVFVAKSSMVIVFLLVAAFVFLLRNLKRKVVFKQFFITSIGLLVLLYSFIWLFPEARFARLVTHGASLEIGFIDGILAVIRWDGSINDRVLNAVFPYFGIALNYGLPGGLYSFYDMSLILVEYFDGFFWSGLGSNKILSFIGTIIYELGLIGILSISYLYWLVKDSNNHNRIFELILLFAVLNSAIALAFSLVPILIAIMYFKKISDD